RQALPVRHAPGLLRAPVRGFEAQPEAAGRGVRARRGRALHRPAARRGSGSGALVGRRGQGARRGHPGPRAFRAAAAGGMPLEVTLAVLGAALAHATWNAMIKSSSNVLLDMTLVVFFAGVVTAPFMFVVDMPPAAAWPYIIASMVLHLG